MEFSRNLSVFSLQHGESELNLVGRIGGDPDLSEQGRKYAVALKNYVVAENIRNLHVWTSHLKRTIQTAHHLHCPKEHWKALNEIDAVG